MFKPFKSSESGPLLETDVLQAASKLAIAERLGTDNQCKPAQVISARGHGFFRDFFSITF
jgi:hypothetical protein